jgi:hypothetical protein
MARRPFDRNQIQSCTATGGGRVEASIVIEPTQVDLARELHQLTLHVDDLIEPRPGSWPHQFRGSRI